MRASVFWHKMHLNASVPLFALAFALPGCATLNHIKAKVDMVNNMLCVNKDAVIAVAQAMKDDKLAQLIADDCKDVSVPPVTPIGN
jgi:hypothetical protein